MMLYKNMKMVHSSDGDIDFFDIVTWVVQWDTIAPYLFILCLVYELRTSINQTKENAFDPPKEE